MVKKETISARFGKGFGPKRLQHRMMLGCETNRLSEGRAPDGLGAPGDRGPWQVLVDRKIRGS